MSDSTYSVRLADEPDAVRRGVGRHGLAAVAGLQRGESRTRRAVLRRPRTAARRRSSQRPGPAPAAARATSPTSTSSSAQRRPVGPSSASPAQVAGLQSATRRSASTWAEASCRSPSSSATWTRASARRAVVPGPEDALGRGLHAQRVRPRPRSTSRSRARRWRRSGCGWRGGCAKPDGPRRPAARQRPAGARQRRPASLRVRLIDYDGMWVPALDGRRPARWATRTTSTRSGRRGHLLRRVDRFSHLVIYTALRALTGRRQGAVGPLRQRRQPALQASRLRRPRQVAAVSGTVAERRRAGATPGGPGEARAAGRWTGRPCWTSWRPISPQRCPTPGRRSHLPGQETIPAEGELGSLTAVGVAWPVRARPRRKAPAAWWAAGTLAGLLLAGLAAGGALPGDANAPEH